MLEQPVIIIASEKTVNALKNVLLFFIKSPKCHGLSHRQNISGYTAGCYTKIFQTKLD